MVSADGLATQAAMEEYRSLDTEVGPRSAAVADHRHLWLDRRSVHFSIDTVRLVLDSLRWVDPLGWEVWRRLDRLPMALAQLDEHRLLETPEKIYWSAISYLSMGCAYLQMSTVELGAKPSATSLSLE